MATSSTSLKSINLPIGEWVQLPDEDVNSITLLNNNDADIKVKELKNQALTSYSFKDYNPMSIYDPVKYNVGLGEISTIKSGVQENKIFKAENITKRLAAYTKLSKFVDKNNLEISFDFYNPSPIFSKIVSMETTNDIPLGWEWGTTYNTISYTSSYPGGIGMTLFENPNWGIKFKISNWKSSYSYNKWDGYSSGSGSTPWRLVVYKYVENDFSEKKANAWYAEAQSWSINSQNEELNLTIPLYLLNGIKPYERVFVCFEQFETTNDFTTWPKAQNGNYVRITPFQEVILRGWGGRKTGSAIELTKPEFINDTNPTSQPNQQIILDSVAMSGGVFTYHCRYNSTINGFNTDLLTLEYSKDNINWNRNTDTAARLRSYYINENSGRFYFRVSYPRTWASYPNVVYSNTLTVDWSSRTLSEYYYRNNYYGIIRRAVGGSSNPTNEFFYTGYGTQLTTTNGTIGILPTNTTDNGGKIIRPMVTMQPNSSVNLFLFSNWSSKPYPESLPFKNAISGGDAYRISFDIFNYAISLYHGSDTRSSSKPYLIQNSAFPYFTDAPKNECTELRPDYIWVSYNQNDWNSCKIKIKNGFMSVGLNGIPAGEVIRFRINDPKYSLKNLGDYVGVTTTHNFPSKNIGKSFYGEISSIYPALPADIQIKNFKINNQNISNLSLLEIQSLPDLNLYGNSGLEIDGISNTNQIFLQNNSSEDCSISYRAVI
jgi:hypothetical protein